MAARVFLDTNVLVYAYDLHAPAKQARAQTLLTEGIEQENAVVSSQVLGEFFVLVTKQIESPLPAEEARELIDLFGALPVVAIDLNLVRRAIDTHRQYQISYWDALIVAAAERAGCGRILSEDFSSGQSYHQLVAENPFEGL